MKNSWLIRFAVNAVALYAAIAIVPGLSVADESWTTYLLLALFFGIINAFLAPLLKLLTCPIYVFTLGLFSLVVNTLLFMATAWLSNLFGVQFSYDGFASAFLGAIIVSLVQMVLFAVLPDGNSRPRVQPKRPN
ncbi:MAG: phage holin family protein [Anaerolineales bacterium]|nr:phage holin family protein [Anaerolineales bacterium]MCL4257592.1 phage holin family protein [Anaerolineales bacterium]QYK51333.1 MAG: phage holin family protein [Anaerolineales bacterium]